MILLKLEGFGSSTIKAPGFSMDYSGKAILLKTKSVPHISNKATPMMTINVGSDAIARKAFNYFKRNVRLQLMSRRVTDKELYDNTETKSSEDNNYLDSFRMNVVNGAYVISIGDGDSRYAKLIDRAFPEANKVFLKAGRHYFPYKEKYRTTPNGWVYIKTDRIATIKHKPVDTDVAWSLAINQIARDLNKHIKVT